MEKRRHKRRNVDGSVGGRMIQVEHLEIIDVSLSGMRFSCLKNISPNSLVLVTITRGSLVMKAKGVVVRSSLTSFRKVAGDTVPVYDVAMTFKDLTDRDLQSLEELIHMLDNE